MNEKINNIKDNIKNSKLEVFKSKMNVINEDILNLMRYFALEEIEKPTQDKCNILGITINNSLHLEWLMLQRIKLSLEKFEYEIQEGFLTKLENFENYKNTFHTISCYLRSIDNLAGLEADVKERT